MHVLQHHIAVTIEGLDTGQQLLVVPDTDQYLRVILDALKKERVRSDTVILDVVLLLGPTRSSQYSIP